MIWWPVAHLSVLLLSEECERGLEAYRRGQAGYEEQLHARSQGHSVRGQAIAKANNKDYTHIAHGNEPPVEHHHHAQQSERYSTCCKPEAYLCLCVKHQGGQVGGRQKVAKGCSSLLRWSFSQFPASILLPSGPGGHWSWTPGQCFPHHS